MSAFLSGAAVECGPSNVLKNVHGKLDRDTSLQQDRLVSTPNVASSSKQPFKSQLPIPATSSFAPQNAQSPFDITSLRQHLPPTTAQQHETRSTQDAWAHLVDGRTHAARQNESSIPRQVQAESNGWAQEYAKGQSSTTPTQRTNKPLQPVIAPWKRPIGSYNPIPSPQAYQYHQYPQHALASPSSAPAIQQSTAIPREELIPDPQDALARTAKTFVNELERPDGVLAANPKLAQSKFMSLLKGLGSGGVIIDEGQQPIGEEVGEGANLVSRGVANGENRDWANSFMSNEGTGATNDWADSFMDGSSKGKNKASENDYTAPTTIINGIGYRNGAIPSLDPYATPPNFQLHNGHTDARTQAQWETSFNDQEALIRSSENVSRKSVHFDPKEKSGVPNTLEEALGHTTSVPGAGIQWEEEGLDLDDFNDEVFMGYNGMMRSVPPPQIKTGVGQSEGWGKLQNDWERFVRTEPGKQNLRGQGVDERYLFQRKNPYFGVSEIASYWEMESPTLKGVLELEAAVQNSPTSYEAWYNLGLKQQENEREESAILALSKTIQLQPDYRPAYLALAVSYTNENEVEAACTMLEQWIRLGGGANPSILELNGEMGKGRLIERLIGIARENPEEVDADVQVALGVLFNATEEYQKAEDCFLAALSVRPDDWLLYNRLGATLANSGRSNEAIQYYHKALELHPNFVRALFNLAISYINLGQYPLSAQSALDALRIQHSDASEGYSFGQEGSNVKSKGVTSDALWNALRSACIHMNRHDLVGSVEQRDLSDTLG
uniref:Uncharacterized protein n=1 Tax=Kwoniella bestiolae CBS 10118 TaxID=1296100 RepID=A0A1B9FVK3_9TREE|nr:hypothetical protein I302_07129 [Kwoniella bestiolae CBS 10118]OCF22788.1 hypothetical protein I302_07129 [Kwoniella bestiolae CBS 10118]